MRFLYIATTLSFVTYGQLILKHEMNKLGPICTANFGQVVAFFFKAIMNWGVLSGLMAATIAALSWMAVISKYELSSVYPLLSLNFVLVPLLSTWFFGETLNLQKIIGIAIIVFGIVIFSRGI